MYRLPRAVLTQILAVRRKKEQGLPVDDGTEGWMLELVELMEMQVRILCCCDACNRSYEYSAAGRNFAPVFWDGL